MDKNSLYLKIVSPEKTVFSGEILSVTLPGKMGSFTILPQHAPVVSSLKSGKLMYISKDGKENTQDVEGGFVEMSDNQVSVCID